MKVALLGDHFVIDLDIYTNYDEQRRTKNAKEKTVRSAWPIAIHFAVLV